MRIPDRRRKLLGGRIQNRFIALQVVYFLVFAAVFLTVTFGPLIVELLAPDTPRAEREMAAQQFLALHARVWPSLILVLLLFSLHSLLISHRFAGPLYRFRRTFEQVSEGDLSIRVVLRKRDYLKPEAEALDAMVASLRERVRELSAQGAILREEVERLRNEPELSRIVDLSRLAAAEAGVASALARFRTAPGPEEDAQGQAPGSRLERGAPALSKP